MTEGELIDVTIPRLGESVIDITIEEWLRQPGEMVRDGEPLARISTDKVDTDVVAPSDGEVLGPLVEPGETVAVGTVIARIRQA